MKILSQKEVAEKIARFNELMKKEKELQEELMSLEIYGSIEKASAMQVRHDEIIDEIEEIRMKKMLPILEELSNFVAYCQKVENGEINLGDPWPELDEEKTEA